MKTVRKTARDLARRTADDGGFKALMNGLEALRILAASPVPMTSTDLAERLGLHQSTVSRILKTLMLAGYVRKPDYHSFAADYGVLTLAGNASAQFAIATHARPVVAQLSERAGGLMVALATLWQGALIYFVRAHQGQDPLLPAATGYPLHLSSIALRILIERPVSEALAELESSRRRHGWERLTPHVPATPELLLKKARGWMEGDVLVLEDIQKPEWLSAAILVSAPHPSPLCLSVSGPMGKVPREQWLSVLHDGRKLLETDGGK